MEFAGSVRHVPVTQPTDFSQLMSVVQAGIYTHLLFRDRLTTEQIGKLTGLLERNTSIEGFRLPYCYMTSKNLTVLLNSIANNRSMQWLQISCDTAFDADSWLDFENYLKSNEILRVLHVRWSSDSQSFVEALSKGLAENVGIGELSLKGAKLGPRWTSTFAEMLKVNNSLHTLVLSSAGLLDECIIRVCSAIAGKNTIIELDVSTNEITGLGAKTLAALLSEEQCAITKLGLRYNRIENEGAEALARMLRRNERLTSLDITNNGIRDVGIAALASVLAGAQGNLELQRLECKQSYPIIKSHVISIHKSLKRNVQLRKAAFNASLTDDEIAAWNCGKLMVVGQAEAGKTATVRALLSQEFEQDKSYTLGIEMQQVKSTNGNVWMEDRAKTFVETFVKKLKLERLVRSIETKKREGRKQRANKNRTKERGRMNSDTKPKRKSIMEGLMRRSLRVSQGQGTNQLQEVETKTEEEDGVEDVEEEEGMQEEEASLKISLWDYGGQKVFHTVHHLFLTKYGVYLVVFNMAAFHGPAQRRLTEGYLRFWLNTINLHAADAPVIIAGTHSQGIDREKREEISQLIESITDRMHNILRNPDNLVYFPIENSTSNGIVTLRNAVASAFRDQEFVNRKIPYSWVKSLDAMKKKQRHYLRYRSAEKIMLANGVPKTDVEAALSFLHELGLIYHFSKTASLKDKIVMNPDWLVDEVCKVVRDKKLHRPEFVKRNKLDLDRAKKVDLEQDVTDLFNEALATTDLLKHFWEEHEGFMIDLMKTHLLMGDWVWSDPQRYFVPAMAKSLRKARKLNEPQAAAFDAFPKTPAAVFQFNYLPEGVFQRLECECVRQSLIENHSSQLPEKPILYKDVIKFHYRKNCVVFLALDVVKLTHVDTPKRVWVFVDSPDPRDDHRVRNMIKELLDKLKEELFAEAFRPRALTPAEIVEITQEDERKVKQHALEQEV